MAAEPISILRRTLAFARSIAAWYTRSPTLGSTDSVSTNSLTWHNPPSDSLSDSNSPRTPAGRTNTDGGPFQEESTNLNDRLYLPLEHVSGIGARAQAMLDVDVCVSRCPGRYRCCPNSFR